MKKIIYAFITWRIFIFLPLASFLFLTYRSGYDYTNIWKFTTQYFPISNPFLFPWANFDGVHYLSIAANGYSNDLGFFPLYPILIKILSGVFNAQKAFDLGYFISGFLISNLAFLGALLVFYKLLRFDFNKEKSLQALFMLLIFPTSFFFGSLYTESLFLLFTLLSFYFARKEKWFYSSIFAALLSASRVVGIAMLPALLYEFYRTEKKLSIKILPILFSPIGLISYAFYNYWNFGNAFLFIKAHEEINPTRSVTHMVLFAQTVFRYIKILLTTYGNFEWGIALLELTSFFFAVLMLFIAWKKKVRISYLIFSVFAFLVPISSGTFSGLPRYILILFPMFIALALIENKFLKFLYFFISAVLLILLTVFFSRGYFVA